MGYTMKEMNEKMTIFYSENTGEFALIFKGIVDWEELGDKEADYRSYCIRKVLKINNTILNNPFEYKVDLEANKIIKKPVIKEDIEIEL